jgi:hypothetical protein
VQVLQYLLCFPSGARDSQFDVHAACTAGKTAQWSPPWRSFVDNIFLSGQKFGNPTIDDKPAALLPITTQQHTLN